MDFGLCRVVLTELASFCLSDSTNKLIGVISVGCADKRQLQMFPHLIFTAIRWAERTERKLGVFQR